LSVPTRLETLVAVMVGKPEPAGSTITFATGASTTI
jgi:hypothetical protein